MVSTLTKKEWKEILLNNELTNELNLSIFQTLYAFNEYKASASEIGLTRLIKNLSKLSYNTFKWINYYQ